MSREISSIHKSESGYFEEKKPGDGVLDGDMWYAKYLRAMQEPSLVQITSTDAEIYRFLWLRSFHHPITVRLERTNAGVRLSTTELSGTGGYEPGAILHSEIRDLDDVRWCEFLALLDKADYWKLGKAGENPGDGAQWVLEGVREGRYHLADRWSPTEGDYREACLYLLQLAGIDTKKMGDDLY